MIPNLEARKNLIDFLGPEVLRWMVLGIFAGVSVFAVELATAYGIQAFLQALGLMKDNILNLPLWIPTGQLKMVLAFIVLLAALRSALYFCQVYVPNATYNAFGFRQRRRLVEWSFSAATVNTPYVSTLYTERVTLSSSFINGVQYIVIYGCTSLLIAAALLYLSPILFFVSFLMMGLFLVPVYFFNVRIRNESVRFSESWEQANRRLLVGLKNIFLIRIYGAEKEEVQKSQASLAVYSKSHSQIYKLGAVKFSIPQFVGVLIICLTVYIGKNYYEVEAGVLVSFLYLFFRWVQNLSFIYLNAGQVLHYRPQIDALYDWYLKSYKDFEHKKNKVTIENNLSELKKFHEPIGWKADQLSYKYSDREQLFNHLSFEIKPSTIVSIRGPSGSGKTTLISLLLAQLDAGQRLTVNEKNHPQLSMAEAEPFLMTSIGYAGPEPFIIEGTVRENLLFANHELPSDQEIYKVLEQTECLFVHELPKKLDFRITEQGQGLSTGQKQRLSLARALLRKPKALFLDEALSNVDQSTRNQILTKLCELKAQFTLIFISHFEFESIQPDLKITFKGPGQVEIQTTAQQS